MTTCSNMAAAIAFPQRRPLAWVVALVFALGGSAQAAVITVTNNVMSGDTLFLQLGSLLKVEGLTFN